MLILYSLVRTLLQAGYIYIYIYIYMGKLLVGEGVWKTELVDGKKSSKKVEDLRIKV